MKPKAFNYCEYVKLKDEADKRNAYIEALQAKITELTAERDALAKQLKTPLKGVEVE